MKYFRYILILSCLALFGCAKADDDVAAHPEAHSECKIRVAYTKTLVPGSADIVYATIDESVEPAEIVFKILKPKWDLYDLSRMKVRVTVTYDVMLEPNFGEGTLDLSDYDNPLPVKVRNTVTGEEKNYVMKAYKSVDLK